MKKHLVCLPRESQSICRTIVIGNSGATIAKQAGLTCVSGSSECCRLAGSELCCRGDGSARCQAGHSAHIAAPDTAVNCQPAALGPLQSGGDRPPEFISQLFMFVCHYQEPLISLNNDAVVCATLSFMLDPCVARSRPNNTGRRETAFPAAGWCQGPPGFW